jgi:chitinase
LFHFGRKLNAVVLIGCRKVCLGHKANGVVLGTLSGIHSFGRSINDAGQVTGYATTSTSTTHAFLYSHGQMTDLGTLGGSGTSYGYGINDAGQVTGSASTSTGQHAFLYTNGQMIDLGTLPGHSYLDPA